MQPGYALKDGTQGWHLAGEAIGIGGEVATVLTEVEVDATDPAFKRPTKPIGPFFTRYRAEALERGPHHLRDADRLGIGLRHVVGVVRRAVAEHLGVDPRAPRVRPGS